MGLLVAVMIYVLLRRNGVAKKWAADSAADSTVSARWPSDGPLNRNVCNILCF